MVLELVYIAYKLSGEIIYALILSQIGYNTQFLGSIDLGSGF